MCGINETGNGFSAGKRWTLKQAKEDETNPGPKYNPEQVTGIRFKNKFARGRSEVKMVPLRGTDSSLYCRESPAHEYDLKDHWKRGDPKKDRSLTIIKGNKIPGEHRGLLTPTKLAQAPSATSYENTNEIMHRHVHNMPGAYTIGRDSRKIDFVKFSSMHNELVEKGYY